MSLVSNGRSLLALTPRCIGLRLQPVQPAAPLPEHPPGVGGQPRLVLVEDLGNPGHLTTMMVRALIPSRKPSLAGVVDTASVTFVSSASKCSWKISTRMSCLRGN